MAPAICLPVIAVGGNLSIRRLSYLLLAVLLVPPALLLANSIYSRYQREIARAHTAALNLALTSANDAASFIGEGRFILEQLSTRPLVRALDPGRCDPILRDLKHYYRAYVNLLVLDPSGQVLCNAISEPGQPLPNLHLRDFVKSVSVSKKFAIGTPAFGKTSGLWIVPLVQPLLDDRQNVIGMLGLSIGLARFKPQFVRESFPAGAEVSIVDSDGTYIARSTESDDQSWLGQRFPNTPLLKTALGDGSKSSTVSQRGMDGLEYVAGVARVSGTDWHVIATIPTRAVVVTARDNVYFSIAAVVLAMAGAIAAAAFVIRRIEQPIYSIATTARAQMRGEKFARAAESGAEEIAAVAKQFNLMLDARDQVEEALSRSQERYRLVESAVNDGIWDTDIATGDCYMSPRWKAMLGYADDEIANNAATFFDLVHPDDRAALQERRREYLELKDAQGGIQSEYRLRHKNGDYRWVRSRGSVSRDAANRPVRMVGTITDITNRKRVEALIEESRDNLARAEKLARMGHYKIETAKGEVFWSEGLCHIVGKDPASFTPTLTSALELTHPDDRPLMVQLRSDMMAGIERAPLITRLIKDDGQLMYVQGWSQPLRDSKGAVIGIFGSVQDITALKQAEEALRQSQDRYQLVESAVNDGIWDWNILTDEEYMSPRWKAIAGYADDELPNFKSSFLNLVHPDDKARVADATRAALEQDKPFRLEYRLRHKDGGHRWVHSRGSVIRDATNRPIRMLGAATDITERKRAQLVIEESRDSLARAEKLARLGHFKLEVGASAIGWSEGYYAIVGKAPGTFTPTLASVLELVHPDDRPKLEQFRRDLFSGIQSSPLLVRVIRDDGQTIYVEGWAQPLRDSDGAVIGMFGTVQDVTARKRTEEALRQSQERYRLVEDAVNDGVWDWNILTGEEYLSPRWKNFLGYTDSEIPNLNSSFYNLVHPDDKVLVAGAMRSHLEDHKPYVVDIRLRHKDGTYRWVHSRGSAIRDATGRPIRMLGATTEITEGKQAQLLIEESRNNLARAEIMALLGHIKYEKQFDKYTWSEGVYRMIGKAPETFTATLQNALELTHPDDQPMLRQYRSDVLAGHERPSITLRTFKPDGRIVYFELWLVPIRGDDGTVTGMFGTAQDVTARKLTEQVLAQTNQELEERVAERTAALAEEMRRREAAQMNLAQMQKMEAVGQLTAGIAHDFNNLLAVIKGVLEFVEEAAARGLPSDPELIDTATRATRRGADLVQRLLAFSRQAPLKAEPARIDQVVLDTLRLLRRTLGEGIDIVTRTEAQAAEVRVDRNLLANALLNLALNARDAMPEGGQLTIATACGAARWATEEGAARWPTGEEVRITFTDTGLGMTDEVRNRAFEPFFTTKPDGLGSGLGLSMVHGFVEQSGGHIEIESAVGCGTTITIRLPKIEATNRADEGQSSADMSSNGRERIVLLVEDDPDVRIVTAAQLKKLGYRVHAVANGSEAIDMIASPAKIDITLTDIVLPGEIDGVTLVKEAMRARPGIGVLCMSGYDPTHTHRKWLRVQNIEFLEKPFSSARLAQAIEAVLAA
jgi:PAS domain S-box-containing protein